MTTECFLYKYNYHLPLPQNNKFANLVNNKRMD